MGHDQLHERLRADPRVPQRRAHQPPHPRPARRRRAGRRGRRRPLVHLAAAGARAGLRGGPARCAVRPAGEAPVRGGRTEAARGRGVVRDPSVWRRVLDEVSHRARSQRERPSWGPWSRPSPAPTATSSSSCVGARSGRRRTAAGRSTAARRGRPGRRARRRRRRGRRGRRRSTTGPEAERLMARIAPRRPPRPARGRPRSRSTWPTGSPSLGHQVRLPDDRRRARRPPRPRRRRATLG